MSNHTLSSLEEKSKGFPWVRFIISLVLNISVPVGLFWKLAPNRLHVELGMGIGPILGVALLMGIPLSFFEYFYHRYVLHAVVIPFLRSQYVAHTLHHGLTPAYVPVDRKNPTKLVRVLRFIYPITLREQEKAMHFPFWSLQVFYLIFAVTLGIPFSIFFPNAPIWIGFLVAVTVYYSYYEIWHAILHLPFDKFWKKGLERSKFVRRTYTFHLIHHWNEQTNMAIVGFWGIAIPDYVLGTILLPKRIPLLGEEVCYNDQAIDPPRQPVRYFDSLQKYKLEKKAKSALEERRRNS